MAYVEINGVPPGLDGLHRAATWNYGHFTSMQVRDRRVAGLAFHLDRLRAASAVLFPELAPPGDGTVVALIVRALRDLRDASVRVTVLPLAAAGGVADVMVSVSEPVPDVARAPLRVRTVVYERELSQLKHVATLGLTYHAREARRAGFDDALFVGRDGDLREGTVWNVAFWDGERVIWPDAPVLGGITMRVLKIGLEELRIPYAEKVLTLTDLPRMRGAVAVNSHSPAQPIGSVDGVGLPGHPTLTDLLRRAWSAVDGDELTGAGGAGGGWPG
ncbi:aminotransferase class IV [Actinoplanes sp. NPDC051851]|uniref:aminotransferase class IV n=1 Tax=Actinoplanes sp. NPDC051851 TaxID=3154753 RepID=UPI00343E55D0